MNKVVSAQFGCGLSCPQGWLNFDASPTLRIQKIPVVGKWITKNRVTFPDAVKYGDVLKGLPLANNSVDHMYCSHVLEHLSFQDFHNALKEVHRCLKVGGEFRVVMPDLKPIAEKYLKSDEPNASLSFLRETMLGIEDRPKGMLNRFIGSMGNHHHLWLWDNPSTIHALEQIGFTAIRKYQFDKEEMSVFAKVEEESRFYNAISISCLK